MISKAQVNDAGAYLERTIDREMLAAIPGESIVVRIVDDIPMEIVRETLQRYEAGGWSVSIDDTYYDQRLCARMRTLTFY